MKVLIIVAAFLLVQVYGKPINAKCDPALFNSCTDTFAKALGLPAMPTDANVLDKQIKQLQAQGKQAQVCQAAGNLQNCLGDEYNDCLSVAFLKSIGESDADAKEFVAISQQLEKQCTRINLNAINAKCDRVLFGICSYNFAKALGLPAMPADPNVLDKQIKQLEAQGKKKQICQAGGAFQQCLGGEYSDCVSVDYLKSIGESDADAKEFVAIGQQLVKMCTQIQLNAINAKCEPALYKTCTDTYAKALGLASMPTNASVLIIQVDLLLREGKVVQFCQATNTLDKCLGAENDDCWSVAFLKSIGISDADAQVFARVMPQEEEICAEIPPKATDIIKIN